MNADPRERPGSIPVLFAIFCILMITVGCVQVQDIVHPPQETVIPARPQPDAESLDFPVLISTNIHTYDPANGTLEPVRGTITRNFSEIVADNFSDIPVIRDLTYGRDPGVCFHLTNASNPAIISPLLYENLTLPRVSEIALQNISVRKMLRNAGIIEGLNEWIPYHTHPKDQPWDPCDDIYPTLELEYNGSHVTAIIEKNTGAVADIWSIRDGK